MSEKSEKLAVVSLSQILVALAGSLCAMCVGSAVGYTGPALPSMKNENVTSFKVSDQEASWVGGIMPLGALVGSISGGPLVMYLGRKPTIMLTFLPFFISWLLIAFAPSVIMVILSRSLNGFAVGVVSLAVPIYLGETIHPLIRGTLSLLVTLIGNVGILVCFTIGSYLTWSQLALVCGALCVPFLVVMFFVPESPRWYMSKGNVEQAERALIQIRRKNSKVNVELMEIEKSYGEPKRASTAFTEIFRKRNLKAVFIALALMFFQQFSGVNAIVFYAVMIFNMAGSTIDSNLCIVIVGIVNFFASLVAAGFIDHTGRKILLILSAMIMLITLFVLSVFFFFKSIDVNTSTYGWLPLVCLMLYFCGFSIGFGPIPWLMLAEILPSRVRGPGASLVVGCNWTCTFIVTKSFQDIIDVVGPHGAFGFFCFICTVGLIFVVFMVPETKNKSLEEIEEELTGGTGK